MDAKCKILFSPYPHFILFILSILSKESGIAFLEIRGNLDRIERMNRIGCKYKMLFSPYPCISSCSSSPSCPKNLESSLRNTGKFRQDREDEQDKCRSNFRRSAFAFHPVHPLHPVQRFWNLLNFEIWGNLVRIYRNYKMNADSISGISHLHFILSILSKESPSTFQRN